jgi:predicted dehydrogenase
MVGVRVNAIVEGNTALAAQIAGQYVGIAAFPSMEDALQGETYDIVDVCLPPHQQAPVLELALKSGAHVICEKPLCTTSQEAHRLVSLADLRERLLFPGFVHRFHPPNLFLQDLIENDDLGTITQFRCRFSGLWEDAEALRTGDILTETAVIGVDLFRALCGEVVEIQGHTRRVQPLIAVPDTATLFLTSERGTMGTVEASWSSPGGHNRIEVYGTAGACIVDYETEALRYLTADQPIWQHRHEQGPNRYERFLSHVADAVRGLQPPALCGTDGARALEICEAIYPL